MVFNVHLLTIHIADEKHMRPQRKSIRDMKSSSPEMYTHIIVLLYNMSIDYFTHMGSLIIRKPGNYVNNSPSLKELGSTMQCWTTIIDYITWV
jgi:hypothetical protein